MSSRPLHIAALIPAFNEAGRIARVVEGVRPHVDTVLVVDDGSEDGTGAAAEAAGAEVVRHDANRGKGHAVRTGLEALLPRAFTHVLFMDGDLQHRPEDVPGLVAEAAASNADVVVGARVFDRARMPRSRYYSNVIGSRALAGFTGVPVSDSQSGFRLIRTDVLRRIRLTSTKYEIETEMLIRLAKLGVSIREVPVTLAYEGARSKLRPIRDTTRTCFLAVYYRYLCRD
ncbi:MAG TPA: glycosyltransferase family 2 protein [Vicinamibacterales bacterium]